MGKSPLIKHSPDAQRGAAAIEFALVFPLLLLLFLAVVTYGTLFVVQSAMTSAAQDGVRASLRVDPLVFGSRQDYEQRVIEVVTSEVRNSLNLLPSQWVEDIEEAWGEEGPARIEGDALMVELRYPQGSPLGFVTVGGIFSGIGLLPEDGISAQAQTRIRTDNE